MAQRRMSRKSFRKSKGRKTRSMRKRTMGGGVSVQELVQKAEREYNLGNNEAVKKLLAPLKNEGMFSGITRCPSNQKQCEDRKAKSYAEAYVMTNTEIFKKKMYTHAENAVIHTNPNYYLNLANEKFKKTTTQTPPEPETSSPEPAPEPAPAPAATSTSAKKLLELEIIIQELQVKFNGNLLPADKFSSEYLKQFINRCQEKYSVNFTPNTEIARDQLVGAFLLKHKDIIEAENYKRLAPPFQKFTINDLEKDTRIAPLVAILTNLDGKFGGRKTRRRRNKKSRKTRRR